MNHLKRFVSGASLDAARRYQSYLRNMAPDQRRDLYAPEVAAKVDFEFVESLGWHHFQRLPEGDFLDRALYQDLKMYLPDDILALSDRIGMFHSLELRVPFVDHEIVEFCAKIPSHYKIRARTKKYLLREVAKEHLPASVFSHRKQGFAAPMAKWLRGDLRHLVEDRLGPSILDQHRLFNSDAIRTMIDDHHARRSLNDKKLFSLLVFDNWLTKGRPSLV